MSYEHHWITADAEPPADKADVVNRLRAFANGDLDPASAQGLAQTDADGLLALVEVLETRQDGARLALLREADLPKKVRKAVGRSIHKLRTRGIDCESPTERVGRMSYVRQELPSWMAAPDPAGFQPLILGGVDAFGQPQACYAVVDSDGVHDLVMFEEPSRTRMRKAVADMERPQPDDPYQLMFTEADPILVRTRLRQAAERQANDRALPQAFSDASALMAGELMEEHPVFALLSAEGHEHANAQLVARGTELLGRATPTAYEHGLADRPAFEEDWQKAFHQRMDNALESPVVINDAQRRERLVEELDRITRETFTPEFRQRQAERLLDTGYVLLKRGHRDPAAIAVATANALRDESVAVLDIPWARESVHGVVDLDEVIEHFHSGHVHGPHCDHAHDHDDDKLIVG